MTSKQASAIVLVMGHEQQGFRLPADLSRRFDEKAKRLKRSKVSVFTELVQEFTDGFGPMSLRIRELEEALRVAENALAATQNEPTTGETE